MRKPKLIYQLEDGAFPIQLHQLGKDKFRVRYGLQEWTGNSTVAAHRLGEAMMHCFACDGKFAETGE